MDGNGYDDITVGSYESGQAVMLRTRPIVHLTAEIGIAPTKFNISQTPRCLFDGLNSRKHCVVMTFKMSYTTEPARRYVHVGFFLYRTDLQ